MTKKRGRKREYGDQPAGRMTVSGPKDLFVEFRKEWNRRGVTNSSKMVQAAMRLWLAQQAGRWMPKPVKPIPADKKGAHISVTLPPEFITALRTYAARDGRSVPAVMREALAHLIRHNGELSEFRELEEWRFLTDPELTSEEGSDEGKSEEKPPPPEASKGPDPETTA